MDDYDYADREGLVDRLRSWDIDLDEVLEESQESAEERLAEELGRIDRQLEARNDVHDEIVDELEWKVEWYTDRLESLYKMGQGRKDGKRERLQNQIETFYGELREEERKHWRDRQELEQERRDILRELAETEDSSVEELL
jgi:primosomal protein N'